MLFACENYLHIVHTLQSSSSQPIKVNITVWFQYGESSSVSVFDDTLMYHSTPVKSHCFKFISFHLISMLFVVQTSKKFQLHFVFIFSNRLHLFK